jgi:ribosome maturation factor RimP
MDLGSIEERVRAIASKVTEEHNIELVHVEVLGGRPSTVVRIFIDKPAGITHEDCSEISLNVGTILDVEDFIPSSYTLEVSSPGLERELHKLSEYDRFSGQLARIKTRQKIGNQQTFRGRLKGVEGETVLFEH